MTNNETWQNFKNLIIKEALVKGDFTTSGGLKVDHYYDLRKLFADPQTLWEIGIFFSNIAVSSYFKSIGCMATGSIPLVTAISFILNIPFFYVRPKQKQYGLQKQIEGIVKKPYLIIDDVYTTGKSIQQVRDALDDQHVPFFVIINRSKDKDIPALFTDEEIYNHEMS